MALKQAGLPGERQGSVMVKITNVQRRTGLVVAGVVFAATAAIGASSLSGAGEANREKACASETWPHISAYCLEGASDRPVRILSITNTDSYADRFEVAFK